MQADDSLVNQLLIAMPGMLDPNFSTTVTLICEHNDEGALGIVINRPTTLKLGGLFDALGIVINRPTTLKLGGLFDQLSVEDADPDAASSPVLSGGPVGAERGFVLHGPEHSYENTLAVSDDIRLTLSRDIIDAMAKGEHAGGIGRYSPDFVARRYRCDGQGSGT
jgi:putative transcriptional regulator